MTYATKQCTHTLQTAKTRKDHRKTTLWASNMWTQLKQSSKLTRYQRKMARQWRHRVLVKACRIHHACDVAIGFAVELESHFAFVLRWVQRITQTWSHIQPTTTKQNGKNVPATRYDDINMARPKPQGLADQQTSSKVCQSSTFSASHLH